MHDRKLIGVDIGTQGVKAAVFAESGICLATAFWPSRVRASGGGKVEEDPEFQVSSVCRVIARCMQAARVAPKTVAGIAIDGQMAGVIGIKRNGMHVTPYDSWLDTRCAPYVAIMNRKAGKSIVRQAGGAPSFNHGPKILWWKHERPDVYKKIAAFVQPGGYAAMRLCGLDAARAFIDTTYLHFSGFADSRGARWDVALAKLFKVDGRKLPAIVTPQTIVGHITRAMADRCGLCEGTPVAAGCGDTAASFLACGATRPGICVDVTGTASVFATTTSDFCPDTRCQTLSCSHAVMPGLWHSYAYINGGGMNLEWFRKEIAGGLGTKKASFRTLDRLAAALPLSAELPLFVPHMSGRVSPGRPYVRGAWVNVARNASIPHLYYAALEAVALEYGIYCNVIRSLHARSSVREVRVTGGGEKNKFWNCIKANVLRVPVVRCARSEGAPLGSALLAGYATGIFNDLDTAARRWVTLGETVKPSATTRSFYAQRLKRYRALLDAIESWSEVK